MGVDSINLPIMLIFENLPIKYWKIIVSCLMIEIYIQGRMVLMLTFLIFMMNLLIRL